MGWGCGITLSITLCLNANVYSMKRYGKRTTKLLQIRLSVKEYKEVLELLKELNITRRQLILDLIKRKK